MTTPAPAANAAHTSAFELRAHAKQAPRRWHITLRYDDLALCGKHLPNPATTRPISHLDAVPADRRCQVCWPSYRSTPSPAEGNPAPPRPHEATPR